MFRTTRWTPALASVLVAAAVLSGCEDSEVVAPAGSEISVSATPSTIPLVADPNCTTALLVTNCGVADVVATVSSELGGGLPGQDVRFTTNAGLLFTGTLASPTPVSNLPISTDSYGNAHVLLATSVQTTVTAKSGAASGTASFQVVNAALSQILLNIDTTSSGCSSSTTNISSCSQTVCLVAKAVDTDGDPVEDVPLAFALINNAVGMNTFEVLFSPTQELTDVNGEVRTKFTPTSTCSAECGASANCDAQVVARAGQLSSPALDLSILIP